MASRIYLCNAIILFLFALELVILIIFRYLSREILTTTFAVSFVLLVIVMSSRLIKYLAQAAEGEIPAALLLAIISYRVPSFLELVLPMGLFLGVLLAYGKLYVDSEMAVLSACGLTTSKLLSYTLMPSLFVALIVAAVSLFASPMGISKVQEMLADSKNAPLAESLIVGKFKKSKDGRSVTYVESIDDGVMQRVFTAQSSQQSMANAPMLLLFADRAKTQDVDGAKMVNLWNGTRYEGSAGQANFVVTEFERMTKRLTQAPVTGGHRKADAVSTKALLQSDSLEDKATLQWRISVALLVPIVAIIAQALSYTTHRKGRYTKLLPAFLIYLFYLVALNIARSKIESGDLPLAVGMWGVHLAFLCLALLLVYRKSLLMLWRR